jgi:hypothetical protein
MQFCNRHSKQWQGRPRALNTVCGHANREKIPSPQRWGVGCGSMKMCPRTQNCIYRPFSKTLDRGWVIDHVLRRVDTRGHSRSKCRYERSQRWFPAGTRFAKLRHMTWFFRESGFFSWRESHKNDQRRGLVFWSRKEMKGMGQLISRRIDDHEYRISVLICEADRAIKGRIWTDAFGSLSR